MADILGSNFVVTVRAATLLIAMTQQGQLYLRSNGEKCCAQNKNVTEVYFRKFQKYRIIREAGISRTPARTKFSNPFDACALKRDQNMLSIKGEDTM